MAQPTGIMGYGEADITPPVGLALSGFAMRRDRPSTGVYGQLYVRIIVLEGADTSLHLIASFDALGVADSLHRRILDELVALDPIRMASNHCLITATHTHSGPSICPLFGETPAPESYREFLCAQTVRAARQALASLAPATLETAVLPVPGITYNRRAILADGSISMALEPDGDVVARGPLDDRLTALLWRREDGETVAAICHFACHGVAICTQEFGGDAPAAIAAEVATLLGAPCLYLQGAAGDVNPTIMARSVAELAAWMDGVRPLLAGLPALMRPADWGPVGSAARTIPLDILEPLDLATITREIAAIRQMLAGDWTSSDVRWLQSITKMFPPDVISDEQRASYTYTLNVLLNSAEMRRKIISDSRGKSTIDIRVDAMRLGTVTLVAAAAEIFTSCGMRFQELADDQVILPVAFSSPLIGYVPDRAAYAHGGYEVTQAWRYYRAPGPVALDSDERIVATARSLLQQLG